MTVSCHVQNVSCSELASKLQTNESEILVLDSRPFMCFNESHIRQAENVYVPKLLRRRSKGSLKLESIIHCSITREKLCAGVYSAVIVYDSASMEVGEEDISETLKMVMESLVKEPSTYLSTQMCFLAGGFRAFSRQYPELCTSTASKNALNPVCTNLPLQTLTASSPKMLHDSSIANRFCLPSPRSRMSPSKPKPRLPKLVIQQDNSPFSIGPDVSHVEMCRTFPARKHDGTPVQILPHLYLGNACHSSSWETLKGLGITAVMNVSRRCVNHFPLQLKYKNIPVEDDTDSDLSGWFHDATAFIDSVQKEGGRVLVHCKAGISRSATICMSYLMISHAMRVEDAFEFVHRIRAIIAPNLAFMLQLHVLEKDLLTSRANDDDVIDANEVVEPSEQSSCCLVRSMSVPCAIVNCEKEETDHLTTPCLALSSGYVSRSNHFPSSEHCFDHFTSPHHVYHQIASPS